MAQSPGQVLPFEAFQVELTDGNTPVFSVFAYQVPGRREVWVVGGPDQQTQLFLDRMDAERYLQEARFHGEGFRVVELDPKCQPSFPLPQPLGSEDTRSTLRPRPPEPIERALQESPTKSHPEQPGPLPAGGTEPTPPSRAIASDPVETETGPAATKPADSAPSAAERAASTSPQKSLAERRGLAFAAGAEQFFSDTLMLPALSQLMIGNVVGAYSLYRLMRPAQKAIGEDAQRNYYAAQQGEHDTAVDLAAYAGMLIPSLIPVPAGPAGSLGKAGIGATQQASKGLLASAAASHLLDESTVALMRFTVRAAQAAKGFCFAPGTLVPTPSGARTIEALRIGDAVLSWDASTGRRAVGYITHLFENESRQFVRLRTAGGPILATPHHPFWISGRGWVPAHALRPGDPLLSADGKPCWVAESTAADEHLRVFNFEVGSFHNYFVSEAGVLVHNASRINLRLVADEVGFSANQFQYDKHLNVVTYAIWRASSKGKGVHGHHGLVKHLFERAKDDLMRQLADYVPTLPLKGTPKGRGSNEHLGLLHGNGVLNTSLKDENLWQQSLNAEQMEHACVVQRQIYQEMGMDTMVEAIDQFMIQIFYPVVRKLESGG
jgi:hypothetical protein